MTVLLLIAARKKKTKKKYVGAVAGNGTYNIPRFLFGRSRCFYFHGRQSRPIEGEKWPSEVGAIVWPAQRDGCFLFCF